MKVKDSIKGNTKVLGIIGDPVSHSFSPVLQTTLAKAMGEDTVYVPFRVERECVKEAVEGAYYLNIQGLNVTVPHKRTVMDNLVEIDELALRIGAVNTLKRVNGGFKGYNTDILGLEKSLLLNDIEIEGKNVVIIGAGGAANAAVVLAAKLGAKQIFIVNRTKENAEKLKEIIKESFRGEINILGFQEIMGIENPEIVIQTTSVGMGEGSKESPVKDAKFFKNVKAAVDIIYTPWETKLLKDAKEMGCITVNGFDMLIYQGIASFEIWNNKKIDDKKAIELKNILADYFKGVHK